MSQLALTSDALLNRILIVGTIIGGIAYAWGQFRSQRGRGASEALTTAMAEFAAMKLRADRLEQDLATVNLRLRDLEGENSILRGLIATRNDLDQKLLTNLASLIENQTKKLVTTLRETRP